MTKKPPIAFMRASRSQLVSHVIILCLTILSIAAPFLVKGQEQDNSYLRQRLADTGFAKSDSLRFDVHPPERRRRRQLFHLDSPRSSQQFVRGLIDGTWERDDQDVFRRLVDAGSSFSMEPSKASKGSKGKKGKSKKSKKGKNKSKGSVLPATPAPTPYATPGTQGEPTPAPEPSLSSPFPSGNTQPTPTVGTPFPTSNGQGGPTVIPSAFESSNAPSIEPSLLSEIPSISPLPSLYPLSREPSNAPTSIPSLGPSPEPSAAKSIQPSMSPTIASSVSPSIEQTSMPSVMPSVSLSTEPSVAPTLLPSRAPTKSPVPTTNPSGEPTAHPSIARSIGPTANSEFASILAANCDSISSFVSVAYNVTATIVESDFHTNDAAVD